MKRISIFAMAALLMTALFAGQAFADAYNVTASFGVRVTEQGISEQVGEITIQGAEAGNIFDGTPDGIAPDGIGNQIITVELLGNATISRTFYAEYNWDGGNYLTFEDDADTVEDLDVGTDPWIDNTADYRVKAVEGDDFFTIEIFDIAASNVDTVVIGHDEAALDRSVPPDGDTDDENEAAGQYSALCFNLEGTIYNSSDPAQQLVQVSYADNKSNTFSGDIYVATVKPATVEIAACDKFTDTIALDFGVDQDFDCGHGTDSVCLFTFEDTAAGALDGEFIFRIGKTDGAKLGIGISGITIQKSDNGEDFSVVSAIPVTENAYWDRAGNEIEEADFDDDDDRGYTAANFLEVATSQIEVTALLDGPGLYRVIASVRYDTCTATPGDWLIDAFASRVPCGGSFGATDWLAAEITEAGGEPQTAVFPYAAGLGAGWYNGLSIWNPNATDLTVNFAITEADGDAYTAKLVVPAGEMSVGLAETLLAPETAGTDSAFGDENYNITATANGLFYGFLFITNGTVAQGYLPIMAPELWLRGHKVVIP